MKRVSPEIISKIFQRPKVKANPKMVALRKKLKVKEVEPGALINKAKANSFKRGVQALI